MCDKNPQKIQSMFNEISRYYDKMNDFISLGTHRVIKKNAIKMLKLSPNTMVLDVCCGTGDFTSIINQLFPSIKVIGLDFSPKMLEIAKQKNPKDRKSVV